MARHKKDKNEGKRKSGQYEYKGVISTNMTGKKIYKSFYSSNSLDKAKERYRDYLVEQRAAEITGTVFVEDDTVNFAQWGRFYLETYVQPFVAANTYRLSYQNPLEVHLIPYFGQAELNSIMPVNVQNFWRTKIHLSHSVQSKIRMVLNGIFDSAIENNKCTRNPARSKSIKIVSTHQKKPVRTLSEKQIEQTMIQTNVDEIRIILGSGARRGEVCGFQWSDYVPGKGIYVNRSLAIKSGGGIEINPPKWESYRFIPLDNKTCAMLDQRPRTSIFIFSNPDSQPLNPDLLYTRIKSDMARVLPDETPPIRPHELRHTYGTHLKRQGVDIFTIQKIMGHKDIEMTTELYVHSEEEMLTNDLKKTMPDQY